MFYLHARRLLARRPYGRRSALSGAALSTVLLCCVAVTGAGSAWAAGFEMFSTVGFSTGEKPQSKLWHHDGSYWGVLQGPDGVAIYEKVGSAWVRGTYANAVLISSGQADVKWNGSDLFVLVYNSTSRLFKYSYDAGQHRWVLVAGFPVTVPNPSGSETMVLDQDSTGRLWTTAEGGGNINVYYSTSADHKTWISSPIVLQTGVNSDDISSVIAFGGNKIGVYWSDQSRWQFGFRVHVDTDPPATWSATEVTFSGTGTSDDHINLAADSQGRVYVINKDANNEMKVQRRATNGTWTTKNNVLGGSSTRGIIQVAEQDSKVYVLYTRWGVTPERIEYRVADINTLTFGGETIFISGSGDMNNVSGMKQNLPAGSLVAVAENGSKCWYNSFGNPPSGTPPPSAPTILTATLGATQVALSWTSVSGVDGYNVYRSVDGGTATKINASLLAGTSTNDNSLVAGQLCYSVRSSKSGVESSASNSICVDNTPPALPPGAPANLTADLIDTGSVTTMLALSFDEGSGQQANDQSGNNNHGRLGSGTGADTADPIWTAGVSGTSLQFDGSNDYVNVADAPSLDPAGSFTIEAWVRRNGTSSMGIVSKGVSGARTYRVRLASGTDLEFRWEIAGGSSRELAVDNAIVDANWHHVACVYDQAAARNRVYVDGILRGSGSASGVPAANASALFVGAYHSSSGNVGNYWNGAIDALRIAPTALYSANFTPPSSSTMGLETALKAGSGEDELAALRVQLAWSAPTSGGAFTGYNVWRSVDGGAAVKINPTLISALSWSDNNPVTGELCYTVRAQNAAAQEGNPSNSDCVTNGPATPPPGAPGSFTATLQSTNPASTLLQWTAPTTGAPATGYNVYRKVGAGSLVKLTASPIATTNYTDSNLVPGTLCYEVAGVDAQVREGTRSASQCVDYAAPPLPPPTAPQTLTAQYVSSPGGAATGVAAWPLDENTGQTFADATGNPHPGQLGTAAGVDTSDPLWAPGKVGSGLLFDGTNDRCVVADAADLKLTSSFTIEAWIQRSVIGATHCVLSKGDSQRRNFWLVIQSDNKIDFRWETSNGSNHGTTSSTPIANTAWHHVAGVFDQTAGQNRIYLDGILVKSSNDNGTPVTSTEAVFIGSRLSSGSHKDFFRGTIDLMRISSSAVYSANFTPPTSFGGGPPTTTMQLAWAAPSSGTPAGYNVYRQVDGGGYTKINAALVGTTSFTDPTPPAGALCYQVTAVDAVPQEGPPSDPACPTPLVTKQTSIQAAPSRFEPALAASPNPFNPSTQISFRLPEGRHVDLAIYDARGRRVATLASGFQAAGEHVVRWSGRDATGAQAASGAYFLALRAGDIQLREKLILLK